jgi:protein tyrosine/serine phosphatase
MNRSIALEGCFNFRDLGGYPTADGRSVGWRLLFRSDGLHHLTSRDIAILREEIRLGEVIDLRSSGELRSEGRGILGNEPMRFHHLPLFDRETDRRTHPDYDPESISLADRYFFLAELAKRAVSEILGVLAETELPAVYHCAAGKDRTGVISAILLSVLGVPDEIIVADYAASRENLDAIVDRLMATKGYQEMLSALPPETMHAEPQTMIDFLGRLQEKYGSVQGYAEHAGVPAEQLEKLKNRLLVESP